MTSPNVCIECSGRGYVCYLDDRNPNEWPTQKCPDCGGSGRDEREQDQSAATAQIERSGDGR